jgi:hypothetical protein
MATVDNVRAVHEAIEAVLEHHALPNHVSHRIAVLVPNPQDIQFIDAIGREDGGMDSGEVYMCTSDVVIHVTWRSPDHKPRLDSSSGVEVKAWPRKALASVEIGADPDKKTNIDGDWNVGIGGWPGTGRVILRYSGQADAIVLPLAYRRTVKGERVMDFLPNLLGDLAK